MRKKFDFLLVSRRSGATHIFRLHVYVILFPIHLLAKEVRLSEVLITSLTWHLFTWFSISL